VAASNARRLCGSRLIRSFNRELVGSGAGAGPIAEAQADWRPPCIETLRTL
jgi:hypothetical protein